MVVLSGCRPPWGAQGLWAKAQTPSGSAFVLGAVHAVDRVGGHQQQDLFGALPDFRRSVDVAAGGG